MNSHPLIPPFDAKRSKPTLLEAASLHDDAIATDSHLMLGQYQSQTSKLEEYVPQLEAKNRLVAKFDDSQIKVTQKKPVDNTQKQSSNWTITAKIARHPFIGELK